MQAKSKDTLDCLRCAAWLVRVCARVYALVCALHRATLRTPHTHTSGHPPVQVQLLSISASGPRTVEADWRLGGYLVFPWNPRVEPFKGGSTGGGAGWGWRRGMGGGVGEAEWG